MSEPLTAEEIALLRGDITHALTVLGGSRETVLRLLATLDAAHEGPGLDVVPQFGCKCSACDHLRERNAAAQQREGAG